MARHGFQARLERRSAIPIAFKCIQQGNCSQAGMGLSATPDRYLAASVGKVP